MTRIVSITTIDTLPPTYHIQSVTNLHPLADIAPPAARSPSEVAKRAFVRLMDLWGVSSADAARLMGQSNPRTVQRWKAEQWGPPLGVDALERVSNLLGIHKALGIVFEDKSQRDGWVRRPNAAFGGMSALDVMLGGRITDLMRVRRYLDAVRGGV